MGIGINTKGSVAYFKHQVDAVTAIVPISASDSYLEVSEGPAITASKEVLDSDLISLQIGRAKGQHGLQDAGGSCAFEWRHSGVEAEAPDFDAIVEACLGGRSLAGAEYDCVAGSTTSVINVDAGEGASYEVGEFLLIKHAGHPYEIGVIKSILIDALTLENALDFAPAATTLLGKCLLYKGANSGFKWGTFGLYHGNKNRERAIGCLVETLTLTIEAGQIIKTEVSFKGLNADYVSASAAPHTPTYMASQGLVGLDVDCWVAGSKVDFKSATVTISNEVKEILSAKEESGKVSNRIGARSVEVALILYADDASHANQTKYNELTDFSFVLVAGKKTSSNYVAGNCIGIYLPNCYFSELPRAEEDNILVENAVVRAHRSTGLNEVFLGFV